MAVALALGVALSAAACRQPGQPPVAATDDGGRLAATGAGANGRRAAGPELARDPLSSAPTVNGSLDKELVRRVARQHVNGLLGCYEPERARQPGLGGKVVLRLMIASAGDVAAVALEDSTLKNGRVESCLVNVVSSWVFPPSPGGTSFVLLPVALSDP